MGAFDLGLEIMRLPIIPLKLDPDGLFDLACMHAYIAEFCSENVESITFNFEDIVADSICDDNTP